MAQVRPMLGDLELQPVQVMRSAEERVLSWHPVPTLEGDFSQDLGRRATRIAFAAVALGDGAADRLSELREKFRAAEPVSFVADITTATEVNQVLIEKLTVRERAGKPARYEVAVSLCEYQEPPQPPAAGPSPVDDDARRDAGDAMTGAEDQIDRQVGTLVANLTSDLDPSTVRVLVTGTSEDGASVSATMQHQGDGVFRLEDVPAGQYRVEALPPGEGNGNGD